MAANDGFGTMLLTWIEDFPISVEPFDLGVVSVASVEPFDILGPKAYATSVEPFDIIGKAYATSVEPFDLGSKAYARSDEPFDILGAGDYLLPPTDLGDGDTVAAEVAPIYGWFAGAPDADLGDGDIVTD